MNMDEEVALTLMDRYVVRLYDTEGQFIGEYEAEYRGHPYGYMHVRWTNAEDKDRLDGVPWPDRTKRTLYAVRRFVGYGGLWVDHDRKIIEETVKRNSEELEKHCERLMAAGKP